MSERGYSSSIHDSSGRIKDKTVAHKMANAEDVARDRTGEEKRRLFGLIGPSKKTLRQEGTRAAESVEEKYREAKEAQEEIFKKLKIVAENKGYRVFKTEFAKSVEGIRYGIHVEEPAEQTGAVRPRPIVSVDIFADPLKPRKITVSVGAYPSADPKKGEYFESDDYFATGNRVVRIVEESRVSTSLK